MLHQLLERSAQLHPDKPMIIEPGKGIISYNDLNTLANQLRDRLLEFEVQRGDRVGIYMRKSIDAVASIFGILKTGAAYVPVDPNAPVFRNAYILNNCSVKVVVTESRFEEMLRAEMDKLGVIPKLLPIEGVGGGLPLQAALDRLQQENPTSKAKTTFSSMDDLAYILYTSGSTGNPKGVQLTHRNAISFIDWCSEVFEPSDTDRFSSHAPFHFDLSILDIYVPIKHTATLVLVNEDIGKDPARLASLISEAQISVWYSTPSILSMLAQYGKLERYDYSTLRMVLFAGEVFPIKHLRLLKNLLPKPRYFNLYGPTETNVCTFFEVSGKIPEERIQPFPIGKACSHYRIMVADQNGQIVRAGEEGELCATGPGVMQGYWNLPERTAHAFLTDSTGLQWYKTGDIVYENDEGDYIYVSRWDRMIKKRGYRIELGEIEVGLFKHPAIKEAAVVASDQGDGVRIKAFVSCQRETRPSIIDLKRFCIENLPSYMIPDIFSFQEVLPKTSTDKIDYQKLKEIN